MKTVRQIADEIGVTKQALQKRLSREPLYTRLSPHIDTRNGTKYIDDDGERLIKEAFGAIDKPVDVPVDKSMDKGIDGDDKRIDALLDLVSEQQQTIKDLTAANRELTAALENTTDSLKAAQALHAGTMHKQLAVSSQEDEQPDQREGRHTGKNVTGDGFAGSTDKSTVEISPKEDAPPKKGGFFSKWFGNKK